MSENKLRERKDIDTKYQWKLEDIFPTNQAWEDEFKQAQKKTETIDEIKGTLGKDAQTLFDSLERVFDLRLSIERLFAYSRMRRDEDNSNSFYQALCDRATSLMINTESKISFIKPEILSIDADLLKSFFKQNEKLSKYRHMIDEIFLSKKHTLSDEQERLLSMSEEMGNSSQNIYGMMCYADMAFPTVKDEDGNDIQITNGNYMSLMESTDRTVRKNAFEALYSTYDTWKNTIAAILASSVKKDVFYAKARNFDSSLHASLHQDNVPISVYTTLIEEIHKVLPHMHKYMDIKRKKLGVDKLHMYDLYVSLFDEGNIKVTYDDAMKMVFDAFSPLGDDYNNILREGLSSEAWIDVYENKGKTSGAYSWGVWGSHPYVLMNWGDTIDKAFTLAHELGHAMHTHLADNAQDYVNSQYPLLLAEVASICNEALMMNYILKKTDDSKQKLFLANYFLEQYRTTMFRQVMFAEFEMKMHAMVEEGIPLTAESISTLYKQLNELYYGKDMVIDEQIGLEWARISHFYRTFYVYKYSTGFASAIAISNLILEGDEKAKANYLNFLKSGGKDYPLELLKDAGIDLTKPDTVASALKTFVKLVDEMEQNL